MGGADKESVVGSQGCVDKGGLGGGGGGRFSLEHSAQKPSFFSGAGL